MSLRLPVTPYDPLTAGLSCSFPGVSVCVAVNGSFALPAPSRARHKPLSASNSNLPSGNSPAGGRTRYCQHASGESQGQNQRARRRRCSEAPGNSTPLIDVPCCRERAARHWPLLTTYSPTALRYPLCERTRFTLFLDVGLEATSLWNSRDRDAADRHAANAVNSIS
ncbi:hypothetical protein K466DRAFT_570953 [Polyporus arcularius HHB13444]|uniref:Uncharacterized protein n=1 Tax=Polyporus arcularius HHB13444 TaxID=1314778 RepID=A0A5C3NM01_9APHY|nr:hypothetical protein K466DRAFT_570953 [Polyporus arcularius HHB13444]